MAVTCMPDQQALLSAFDHKIYSSDGTARRFGSLFYDCDVYPAEKRVLVIFIRHFFCGNCQEYVRRLSSIESPFHPSYRSSASTSTTNFSKPVNRIVPSVVLIGPGQHSLIAKYKSLTQCPFEIYADPSTSLYEILGMHRTLSMGKDSPEYIEHSLLNGAVKSAWQITKRLGKGDAFGGGSWDVNGGEFLFTRSATRSRSSSRLHTKSRSRSRSPQSTKSSEGEWQVSWCHQMLNSRDHTEIADLQYQTCFCTARSPPSSPTNQTVSPAPAPALKSILVNGGKKLPEMPASSASHESVPSCPAPEIPESQVADNKAAVLRYRARARSTSTSPRPTARQNHDRIWSKMSSGDVPQSDSSAPLPLQETPVPEFLSDYDETTQSPDIQPRRSFSASVADRLCMRKAVLKRAVSTNEAPATTRTSSLRPSASASTLRSQESTDSKMRSRARTTSGSIKLFRSRSRSRSKMDLNDAQNTEAQSPEALPSTNKPEPPAKPLLHRRSFSFTKATPSHGPKAAAKDNVPAKPVSVTTVTVIIEPNKEKALPRPSTRDRADSGFASMDDESGVDAENEKGPPVPEKNCPGPQKDFPVPTSRYQKVVVTALPQVGATA